MPRQNRGVSAVKQVRKRTRKGDAEGQSSKLVEAEKLLVARYPKQQFVAGSLAEPGQFKEFGNKRSVVILCQTCGRARRIATSDVFHTSRCVDCSKGGKKSKK